MDEKIELRGRQKVKDRERVCREGEAGDKARGAGETVLRERGRMSGLQSQGSHCEVAAVTTAVMLRQEHMHIHSCTHIKFPNGLPTRPPSANSLRQKTENTSPTHLTRHLCGIILYSLLQV